MKLLRLFLVLIFIVNFSCSSSDDQSNTKEKEEAVDTPDDKEDDSTDDDTDDDDGDTGGDTDGGDSGDEQSSDEGLTEGIKYGDNFLVFEPEITTSDLGLWVKRKAGDEKYHVGTTIEAINKGYLEFTGNNKNSGPPTSPIEYTFKCPKTAKYRIVMRMYQPLLDGEPEDKRNDLWIRLKGDFTTACAYPTETLEKDHKLWGRGVRKWGSAHKMDAHVNGNKVLAKVVYNLKKDEVYTLTLSGRAQGCSIDYVLLYEESLGFNIPNHTDIADELPELYRPNIN